MLDKSQTLIECWNNQLQLIDIEDARAIADFWAAATTIADVTSSLDAHGHAMNCWLAAIRQCCCNLTDKQFNTILEHFEAHQIVELFGI